jgi:aminoglycoside phosphotransferase (APT) family kinase protein
MEPLMNREPATNTAVSALAVWFEEQISSTAPLTIDIIPGGRSNLTYRISDASGRHWVVRRPPLEAVLASAHDVLREYRIVSALQQTAVPSAPVVASCADTAIIGAPFAVYGFVVGSVLHTSAIAADLPASERHALGLHVIDVLAELHLLDVDAIGLGDLGPREGYIERQIRRWIKQWDAQSPRRVAAWDAIATQLAGNPPKAQRLSIAHGDYRLGNLIVRTGQVQAVLDWELCTLGDPLADLAYLANNWVQPGQPDLWGDAPTSVGGFPPLATLLERYARRTGLDLSELHHYRAFAQWRLAAILEGVRLRDLSAGRSDQAADQSMAHTVEQLAEDGLRLLQG